MEQRYLIGNCIYSFHSTKIKYFLSDENKFGQKLLEKMGWSQGQGLGKDLDGRTEHVKVCHKMDTKGNSNNKLLLRNIINSCCSFNVNSFF